MATANNSQEKPKLTVIEGADEQPSLAPSLTKGDKILAGVGLTGLAVTGTFAAAANHVIINKDSQSPQEKKAIVVKQTDQWLEGFKHNGQVHKIVVETGDTPSELAAEIEPEAASGSFVTNQAIQKDIASHAPGGGYIQPGQQIEVADIPDGQVAPADNIIAPMGKNPDK